MKRNGFTLIELLVAVVISTVLAAVAIPKFHAQVAKAKAAEIPAVFSAISKAQHIAYLETNQFFTAFTQEEYLDNFGLRIQNTKYFTYETGPTYAELVAIVEIDGIPMVEAGFYIDGVVVKNFGKLAGGEVVEYDFDLATEEESATTQNILLQKYLYSYLFFNEGRNRGGSSTTGESDDIANNGNSNGNKGHGNNVDGDDEDNPGQGGGNHGADTGYDDDGIDDDEKKK